MGRVGVKAIAGDVQDGGVHARLALLEETTGATVATWTALPLLNPSTVTLAFRDVPAVRAPRPLTLTVRLLRLVLVTLPVTPLSKATRS